MSTTVHEIRAWVEEGLRNKCAFVVVLTDWFDYTDYPVYIRDAITFDEELKSNKDGIMEVYDLSLPIESQLQEHRTFHPPETSKVHPNYRWNTP